MIRRVLLWLGAPLGLLVLLAFALLEWPGLFFPYRLAGATIIVESDRPIPLAGGTRLIAACTQLLQRSPLKATAAPNRIYVTNEAWHHRLYFLPVPGAIGATYAYGLGAASFMSGADFPAGRIVHGAYIPAPPRTLAYLCAHELTHIITAEHVGIIRFYAMPDWVREGFPDYVGIEHRESFEQLRAELGARPEDNLLRASYGSYPRYRLLVTYFLEKRKWPVERLLHTDLTQAEATAIMQGSR